MRPYSQDPVWLEQSGGLIHLLPLKWSLSYALPDKQWKEMKERYKKLNPEWERCKCPKRCPAAALDEEWRYDQENHIKVFVGANFLCRGCHWFKSLPHRMQTWLKQERGAMPKLTKPPHIIDCLGLTQDQVDAIRDHDLQLHKRESRNNDELVQKVRLGKAVILFAPVERLSKQVVSRFAKPDQLLVVPWRVDLTSLAQYGYSQKQVKVFEELMYVIAAKRMGWSFELSMIEEKT
jgi:hypothetical protein